MVSPAGSKIPETVVGEFHCNTKAAGWLNGAHPTGKFCTMSAEFEKFRLKPKSYIPSTLNIDLILWHTQLIVCAVKC